MGTIRHWAIAVMAASALGLAGCGGGGSKAPPAAGMQDMEKTPYQKAEAAIAAATTDAAVDKAVTDAKADVSGEDLEKLNTAAAERKAALAKTARAKTQKTALMDAAGKVDTSDLNEMKLSDAKTAIAALQAALNGAADVSDADRAMYQTTLDGHNKAVRVQEQKNALSDASGKLDKALTGFSGATATQAQLDAAMAALKELKAAIAGAKDLADADTARYQAEADRADADDGQLMMAQGRFREHVVQMITDGQIAAAMKAIEMVTDESDDSTVTDAQAKIDMAKTAIEGANLTDEQKSELLQMVAGHQGALDRAKSSRMMAMEMKKKMEADAQAAAMVKEGKAMFAALAAPNGTDAKGALANQDDEPALQRDSQPDVDNPHIWNLRVDVANGAGAIADDVFHSGVNLTPRKSLGKMDAWTGQEYFYGGGMVGDIHNDHDPNKDKGIVTVARVYSDRKEPEQKDLATWYATASNKPSSLWTLTAAERKLSTSGAVTGHVYVSEHFPKSASKYFKAGGDFSGEDPKAITVPGTFQGAPGVYKCTAATDTTCYVNAGVGGVSLAGDWDFFYQEGAKVTVEDDRWLTYGWWLRKDKDGMPAAGSGFFREAGGSITKGTAGTALNGLATYKGHAAGLYGITTVPGTMPAVTPHGGHFVADVTLNARFGNTAVDEAGMTGTIDNFRLNDGDEAPNWSVRLNRGAWGGTGFITPSDTVWSIDGKAAPKAGHWEGQMYDNNTDDTNNPETVVGKFYSEYHGTHRMVGGFGAKYQE